LSSYPIKPPKYFIALYTVESAGELLEAEKAESLEKGIEKTEAFRPEVKFDLA
jgi:hypothetical protein